MPPKRHGKRSFLKIFFTRRNRGESLSGFDDRSRNNRKSKKRQIPKFRIQFSWSSIVSSTRESFHQSIRSLKGFIRQAGSSQLESKRQGGSESFSLVNLVRSLKAGSKIELADRDAKRKSSSANRIRRLFWNSSRQIILGSPALIAILFSLGLFLNYTPSRLVRQLGYTNRFDRAMLDQNYREAEILVKNQLSSMTRPLDRDLFRYALLLAARNNLFKTRELLEYLTEDSDRSYGPAHLELTKALLKIPNPSNEANLKIERHLLRAMVDPESETAARVALGKFYRMGGRFNDAERILEVIRTNEDACIELALVRHSQGRYEDIPTTVSPFVTRWRDQWNDPKSVSEFEHSAIGLVLLNNEKVVLDGLKRPKISIAPSRVDQIRTLAVGLWLDRLNRAVPRLDDTIYQVIRDYYGDLPCSMVWIGPVLRLSLLSGPTGANAVKLRENITLHSDCDPSFLHEVATQARSLGDIRFVKAVYEKILERYPDEFLSRNNLAMLYVDFEPKNPRKALELIEPILEKNAGFLQVYDTRGQIRLALGEVDSAIEDFQKALPVYSLRPEFHNRLAKAYRMANDETNARIHEELAQELAGAN